MRAGHKAHLPAEALQVEERVQVGALPLCRHVEVGQLSLEGPLGGGEGCQSRELRGSGLAGSPRGGCQLCGLLGQLQAAAVLGLSGEGGVPSARVLAQASSRGREPPLPRAELWGFPELCFLIYRTQARPLPQQRTHLVGTRLRVTSFWKTSLTQGSGLGAPAVCPHMSPFLFVSLSIRHHPPPSPHWLGSSLRTERG